MQSLRAGTATAPLPTLLPWTMGSDRTLYAANGDDEAEI